MNLEPVKLIIKFNVQTSKFNVFTRVLQQFPHGFWQHIDNWNLWHGVANLAADGMKHEPR